ncbi:hypothetical protein [Psychroserpens mesophilus]|jgi:hypothetical protein|uniref:hypothetical protein n=1 Tax=Psychroserpens mesophilus TaxID=325473 RepID=UPI003D64E9A3
MTKFNKEDIEPLDFIIDKCLETGFVVTADSLIKKGFIKLTDKQGYGTLTPLFNATKEFVRYLSILDNYDVCECKFEEDAEFARANRKTLHFQKQGGFKNLYAELKAEHKLEKRKNDLEISNLELQQENFTYQKSIRAKEEQIRNLTKANLRLGNWDIRFRWYIAIVSFIIGFIIKHFIDK